MADLSQITSYQEATAVLPAMRRVTNAAIRQIEALINPIHSREEMERRKQEIETARDEIVANWKRSVRQLGGKPRDLWLVEWESGCGTYSWRYPEDTISFLQCEREEASGRLPIN